jgi:organic hydroperoxide reductase OsmC/OhrA
MHNYQVNVRWTGNKGEGTANYKAYDRDHTISSAGKADILGSSDPAFRGDKTKYNPEEMLLASLSTCHMLSYLHMCVLGGIIVTDYTDDASGVMVETPDGGGHFTEVTLYPVVTVADASMIEKANELHHKAHKVCFIANSVNFPVKHVASAKVAG